MAKPADLVQGTLDLLILRTIALEPMHGWGNRATHPASLQGGVAGEPSGALRRCSASGNKRGFVLNGESRKTIVALDTTH
jgi:hypothetical protein